MTPKNSKPKPKPRPNNGTALVKQEPTVIHMPNNDVTTTSKAQAVSSRIHAEFSSTQFRGPLPPPEILIKYNQATPNAADRIITMAENQATHRQYLEKRVIESDIKKSSIGQKFALIVALAFVAASLTAIIQGHDIAGGLLGTIDLVSLVGVFIYGSNERKKEREGKRDDKK